MFDVGDLASRVHEEFRVPVTITRGVLDPREEEAVLHLDGEHWESRRGITVAVRQDTVSFEHDVDVQKGDVITCDDERVVPAETTWEITDRQPSGDTGWLKMWTMKKTS